jgi:hypothetical protein
LRAVVGADLQEANTRADFPIIAENHWIHLVLFGMQNKTFGPFLAAMHASIISVMQAVPARARKF